MLGVLVAMVVSLQPSFLPLPENSTYAIVPRQFIHRKPTEGEAQLTISNPLSPYRESTIHLESVNFRFLKGFGGGRKGAGLGGALLAIRSQVVIEGTSEFEGCIAMSGGALVLIQSDNLIRGAKFTSCQAYHNGGGIMVTTEAWQRKKDSAEPENTETFQLDPVLLVFSCEFHSCKARESGGAISVTSSTETLIEATKFIECVSGRSGGAMALTTSHASVVQSLFHRCQVGLRDWSVSEDRAVHRDVRRQIGMTKLVSGGGAICCECRGSLHASFLITDSCCFILNECVQNRAEGEKGFLDPTAGFDVTVSTGTEYYSYKDRFWNWEDVSINGSENVVKYGSRWYQADNNAKFWNSANNGCAAFGIQPVEDVPGGIGEQPEADPGTPLPENLGELATDLGEASVPENTQVQFVQKPQRTVVQIPTMSDFTYTMEARTRHTGWTFKPSDPFSRSSIFSVTTEFTETGAFATSSAFTASQGFTESSLLTKSDAFSVSSSFLHTLSFSCSGSFSESQTLSPSHTFSPSSEFTASSKFTPWPTYSDAPAGRTLSISWEAVEVTSYSESYISTRHETVTATVTISVDAAGSSVEVITHVSTIIEFLPVRITVFTMSYKPHPILLRPEEEQGISSIVLLGMIVGAALVVAISVMFVIWLIRKRDDDISDVNSYSLSDSEQHIGVADADVVHTLAQDLFNSDEGDDFFN